MEFNIAPNILKIFPAVFWDFVLFLLCSFEEQLWSCIIKNIANLPWNESDSNQWSGAMWRGVREREQLPLGRSAVSASDA